MYGKYELFYLEFVYSSDSYGNFTVAGPGVDSNRDRAPSRFPRCLWNTGFERFLKKISSSVISKQGGRSSFAVIFNFESI